MTTTWRGHQLTDGVRLALMRGLVTVGHMVRNEAVNLITQGPKTGVTYYRRGVAHVASAPGEPPAADLGNLHNSITVQPNPALLLVQVNAGAKYSAALEYGTRKMAARPFMSRALTTHLPALNRILAAEVAHYLATQPSK